MLKMDYFYDEEQRNINPFSISNLKPIQMPNMDLNEMIEGRKQFTKDEWMRHINPFHRDGTDTNQRSSEMASIITPCPTCRKQLQRVSLVHEGQERVMYIKKSPRTLS